MRWICPLNSEKPIFKAALSILEPSFKALPCNVHETDLYASTFLNGEKIY